MEDLQLLRDYAEHRSEQAFGELVRRHMDFVYSSALRLVRESQLAEDVTQLVFMSREEQRRYERAWRDSADGEDFKDSVRNYEFPVQSDGTFWVHDVRPGTYRMQVRADEPVPGGKGLRQAAVVEVRVDVPEISPAEGDQPINLGTLVARPAFGR